MSNAPETQSNTEPRWRRLPGERPGQIMQAALEVFGERGLSASRLEDIAKRAGLSKGTIYLYFPNKEELFREMVRHTVVSQIEQREQLVSAASGTATELLVLFMRDKWKFIRSAQFAPLFRLIHAEIENFPDLATFYAEEVVSRGHRLMAAIIARGTESGEFRDVEPMVAARVLASMFVMHGLWCTHRNCFESVAQKTDEQVLNEIIDFYLHAIRPSGAQPSAPKTAKS
jgi:AcrR family transcriptional regulator